MRSATKWRTFSGHDSPVTQIAFDSEGQHLASFSLSDQAAFIWKVGLSGFYGTILGMSGKPLKVFYPRLDALPERPTAELILEKEKAPQKKLSIFWCNNNKTVMFKLGSSLIDQLKVF